jgi:hypothetical protein
MIPLSIELAGPDRQVPNPCANPRDLTQSQNGPILTPHLLEVCMRGRSKVNKSSCDSPHGPWAVNGLSTVSIGEAI